MGNMVVEILIGRVFYHLIATVCVKWGEMSRRPYYVYVVQIGKNETVVAVNYATDIDRAFRDFLHKHAQIRNSKLRPELYTHVPVGITPIQAAARCRELVMDLESNGFEVIAGSTLHADEWRLYVIEIDGDSKHVYVGQTNYPIDKRFQQHIYKFNPARVLLHHDMLVLREDLCRHLPPSYTKEVSLQAEKALAEKLKGEGYRVEGGT